MGQRRSALVPQRVRGHGDYYVRQPSVRGHGDYLSDAWNWTRGAIRSVGGVAEDAAKAAGKIGSLIAGFGDYKVQHNSLIHGNQVPRFSNDTRSNLISHREYLGDLIIPAGTPGTGSPFQRVDFPINPALDGTFPWLSNLASNYEEYRFVGLLFQFKSNYSDAVVTEGGGLGAVILATEYNVTRAPFSNKLDMENHQYATSSKPSLNVVHPIECAVQDNPLAILFTRSGPVPTGTDPRLYDLGRFSVATQGIPQASADINLGEVWVTYQVELLKPMLQQPTQNYEILTSHWVVPSPAGKVDVTHPFGTSGYNPSTPLSGDATLQEGGTLQCTLTGQLIEFPPAISDGTFMVQWQASGASTVMATGPTWGSGGVSGTTPLTIIANSSTFELGNGPVTSGTTYAMCIIRVTAAGGFLQLITGDLPTSLTSVDLFITQMNPGVLSRPSPISKHFRRNFAKFCVSDEEKKGGKVHSLVRAIEAKVETKTPRKLTAEEESDDDEHDAIMAEYIKLKAAAKLRAEQRKEESKTQFQQATPSAPVASKKGS